MCGTSATSAPSVTASSQLEIASESVTISLRSATGSSGSTPTSRMASRSAPGMRARKKVFSGHSIFRVSPPSNETFGRVPGSRRIAPGRYRRTSALPRASRDIRPRASLPARRRSIPLNAPIRTAARARTAVRRSWSSRAPTSLLSGQRQRATYRLGCPRSASALARCRPARQWRRRAPQTNARPRLKAQIAAARATWTRTMPQGSAFGTAPRRRSPGPRARRGDRPRSGEARVAVAVSAG